MKFAIIDRKHFGFAAAAVLAAVLGLASGCKNQQAVARTDQQIASEVQAKIQGESALAGQNIQVSIANGVATLNGNVTDEASRALAGNDSGSVTGVRTVVNNLTVQPAQQSMAPAPQPAPVAPRTVSPPRRIPDNRSRHASDDRSRHDRDRDEQPAPAPAPPPQVAQAAPPAAVEPPPPPPKPVVKQVTLPAGTIVPVRVTETLDSKTTQPNDVFHGSIAGDIGTLGVIAVPRGSAVMGSIVDAREAAHFKGNSLLSLELTDVTVRGQRVTLVTDSFSKEGSGRGKNTAEKAGGGAALGAIIGALAGGGKGAAIGGLAGGGAGAGINAATRGEQTVIPTETLVNFTLRSPVTLTVTIPPRRGDDEREPSDPQLQPR